MWWISICIFRLHHALHCTKEAKKSDLTNCFSCFSFHSFSPVRSREMTFPTNFNSFFLKALDKGVQCCFSLVGVELYFEVKTPPISYQTSSFSTRTLKLVNFTVFFCIINKEKPEFSFFPYFLGQI